MKSIIYYVNHFGKKSLEEFPFNEVDSLILCQISYLNLDSHVGHLIDKKPPIGFYELFKEENIASLSKNTLDEKRNRKLLKALAKSSRYKDMKIGYFRDHMIVSKVQQFAAVSFIFPSFMYVAYRGTDTTLLGWKEDFNLAIFNEIPAQEEADHYLSEVAKLNDLPIYLGGHSKGGNLAYYAAYTAGDLQDRIIKIYNHDGPGFYQSIFESPLFKNIQSKTHKSVPRDDVVGVLLNHSDANAIVKCKGISIIQHSPFFWKISKEGKFQLVKQMTSRAEILDITLKDILAKTDKETLIRFSDTLFHVLGIEENVTMDWIMKNPIKFARGAWKRYKKLKKSDKALLKRILKRCRTCWIKSKKKYKQRSEAK